MISFENEFKLIVAVSMILSVMCAPEVPKGCYLRFNIIKFKRSISLVEFMFYLYKVL